MCHKTKNGNQNRGHNSSHNGREISKTDTGKYKNVEPLPESTRERRDGPGGE